MTIREKLSKINNKIAINLTLVFGTMWTTYLFFLYGLIPAMFPQYMDKLLYWSNTVQLWSLPLLMVGTNLLGKDAEKRNNEMYEMIKSELEEMKEFSKAQEEETKAENDQTKTLKKILEYLSENEEDGSDF